MKLKRYGIVAFMVLAMVLSASLVFAGYATAPGTGQGKGDFVRTVKDGLIQAQELSDDFTFDSDVDNINQILKLETTESATTLAGNTTGIVLKGYYTGTIGGNSEIIGAASWLLNDATLSGGAKSAIHSFHVHSDNSTTVDRGLAIFGDQTSLFYASGTQTNLFKFVEGDEGGFTTSSLKNSDSGDIKCDAYIVMDVAGTNYYIAAYDTLN